LDEHERERIDLAHELHEQIAQTLAAVLLDLDGLRTEARTPSGAPPGRTLVTTQHSRGATR